MANTSGAKKRKTLSIYQRSNKKLRAKFDSFIAHDKTAKDTVSSIAKGQNVYFKSHRLESSNYDPTWLINIENTIPALGDIIKNPRKVTKTVEEIVPIELARKTNDESVRHLASHTQYVKTIDERGNVIPNKILNIASDDNYLTYENKFIATLVKRLLVFVEKRYEFLTKIGPLKETETLVHKSTAIIDGASVEIETKVKMVKSATESVEGESISYLKRIENVRRYILYYYGSDFMKMFKNEREVAGPIIQTNIIRKNPLYHKCYLLYRYITNYTQLGIDYKVKEDYTEFKKSEMDALNAVSMSAFLALNTDNPSKIALYKEKTYKPRILKTMDDDPFVYGPILDKPISFVRVDEEYFADERKTIGEIKPRATKEEAALQKKDVEKKKKIDEEQKKAEALVKRREKEAKEFERQQAKLREIQRRKEEAERARLAELKRKQDESIIEKARTELKLKAKKDREIEEAELALLNSKKEEPVNNNEQQVLENNENK